MTTRSVCAAATLLAAVVALPLPSRADEAPAARAYLNEVLHTLDAVESDLPRIARAAEAAAAPFIADRDLGVRGGAGLAGELGGRGGGFMTYHGTPGKPGDPILYAFGVIQRGRDPVAQLEREIADARQLRDAGSVVIGLASVAQLRSYDLLEPARAACSVLIDNHCPVNDTSAAPTMTVVNAAIAWAWSSELFAACTRHGYTPVIRKSPEIDYRLQRYHRYQGLRFHALKQLDPIDPGVLGKAYLDALRGVLRDVGTASWRPLAEAAHRAAEAKRAGGRVFIRVGGRYLAHHHGGQLAGDPGVFVGLDHDGSNPAMPPPGPDDFVIALAPTSAPPGTDWWGEPEMLRDAGRGVCWVVSAYLTQPWDLRPNDILVDQQWPVGDALVKAAGYDVRIAPASGVVAEAIMWMLAAQVDADLRTAATRMKPRMHTGAHGTYTQKKPTD